MKKPKAKKPRRVVLGIGYFDIADCRERTMLWEYPLESDDSSILKVNRMESISIVGKRVRLVAEVLE